MPGSVLRETCGDPAEPGRGGTNDGLGGTAEVDTPDCGGLS